MMPDPKVEFTDVSRLDVEALGEPGKRTFRILVSSGSSSAVIWLIKEQLLQLALAIGQLLAVVAEPEGIIGAHPESVEASEPTELDFKLDRMVVSHNQRAHRFVIDAHAMNSPEVGPATIRLWSEISQIKAFAEEALRVCAAGRPLCPFCEGPVDKTGHKCPRTNGHQVAGL
jgi:uncharacterized repeat protein (TIGR03847 family)